MKLKDKVVVISGASSGFGAQMAQLFAEKGANLALCARRKERLESLSKQLQETFEVKVFTQKVDVRETREVRSFVATVLDHFGKVDILVNNAGLALGKDTIVNAKESDWKDMFEANVMGVFRMSRDVMKHMMERKTGHIVNIGSTAAHEPYGGGAGYCGSKFALRAISKAMREELFGSGVRVTTVDPGMAETEFSVVRFQGDEKKANSVYKGMTPLSAQDVAECVLFAVSRPPHVNIENVLVVPTDQVSVTKVFRRT